MSVSSLGERRFSIASVVAWTLLLLSGAAIHPSDGRATPLAPSCWTCQGSIDELSTSGDRS